MLTLYRRKCFRRLCKGAGIKLPMAGNYVGGNCVGYFNIDSSGDEEDKWEDEDEEIQGGQQIVQDTVDTADLKTGTDLYTTVAPLHATSALVNRNDSFFGHTTMYRSKAALPAVGNIVSAEEVQNSTKQFRKYASATSRRSIATPRASPAISRANPALPQSQTFVPLSAYYSQPEPGDYGSALATLNFLKTQRGSRPTITSPAKCSVNVDEDVATKDDGEADENDDDDYKADQGGPKYGFIEYRGAKVFRRSHNFRWFCYVESCKFGSVCVGEFRRHFRAKHGKTVVDTEKLVRKPWPR